MVSLIQTSKDFRISFLLKFTQELINNSKTEYVFVLENQLEQIKEIKKNQFTGRSEQRQQLLNQPEKKIVLKRIKSKIPSIRERFKLKENSLLIPTPQPLPPTVSYIKPVPVPLSGQIDLGLINALINDPTVNTIECKGENQSLIVRRFNGEIRQTGIILTNDEIQQVIQIFSQESKIPAEEGIFKVAVGNLIFSAIISDVVPLKFVIQKLR